MKAVLPAITGKGYGHLAIQDGGAASTQFLRLSSGQISDPESAKIREQLLDYCERDTLGMVWVFRELHRAARTIRSQKSPVSRVR